MVFDYLSYFDNSFNYLLPESFLAITLFALLFFRSTSLNAKLASWILVLTSLLIVNTPYTSAVTLNGMLNLSYFTVSIQLIAVLSSLAILILALLYTSLESFDVPELSVLMLLALLGILLLVSSNDFLMVYLAIELQSLAFYILAALKRDSLYSVEAGLKYFILGALSSGILLFGIALIYGLTGSTDFNILLLTLQGLYFTDSILGEFHTVGVLLGLVFVLVSLLFKLAAAPFHMWAPDVYEGSPMIVTAFFAIVPKIAVFGLLIQILFGTFFEFLPHWQTLLIFSAFTSMILGAFGAIQQLKIKRFLAYSAIGHVGYLLVGLSAASIDGLQAVLLYLLLYIVMSISIFAITIPFYGTQSSFKYIAQLKGLAHHHPLLAISFALTLFSMAGIPPLSGFLSKWLIFSSALSSSLVFLAIVGVLTSVIGAYYYIRFSVFMFFTRPDSTFSTIQISSPVAYLIASSLLITTLTLFNPSALLMLSHNLTISFC